MLPTTIPCGVTDCAALAQDVLNQEICPCDYTNFNGNCGSPLYPSMGCSCPDAATLCNTTQSTWTDLRLGQLTYQYIPAGTYANFRVLLNETCNSIGVRVFTVRGGPYLYINTNTTRFLEDPQLNPTGKATGTQRALFYNLCPGDQDAITGTYFLSVLGIDDTEVGILVVSKPVLDITETPSTAACTAPGNYTCLQDSVEYKSACPSQDVHLPFAFEVVGCQKISIKLDCYGEDDFDLYLSFNNTDPYYGTSRYASYENGDEQLFISVCVNETQTLHITMDCYHVSEGSLAEYSLVVTTQSNWSYIPVNSLPAYGAPWHLVGTSRVIIDRYGDLNSDLNWLNCEHWRYGCEYVWHTYPGNDTNTWWPLPPPLKSFSQFTGVSIDVENVTVNTFNNFKMLLLISVEQDGAITQILSVDQILNTGIEFLDIITNSQGEAVTGVYPIVQKDTSCDFYAWNDTNGQVQDIVTEIGETYDPDQLLSLQYLLGTVQYRDSYYYCKKYANSFLDTSLAFYDLNSSGCSLQFKTEPWQEDPCCWTLRRWNYTCYPHEVSSYETVYNDINHDLLDSYCANPDCTASYLDDYKVFLEDYTNPNSTSGCAAPKESYLDAYNTKLIVYRNCKDQVWSDDATFCVQDSDCGGYQCDLVNRVCLVPLETQEEIFVQCLIDNMDIYQENYVKNTFNINGTRTDPSFFDSYLASLRNSSHCVPFTGLDPTARDHYYLHILDGGCARTGNCPFITCEDSSCALEENACLTWCEFGVWTEVPVDQTQCEQNVYCNWDSDLCEGLTPSECQTACLATPGFFCGWCENNGTCTEIPGISTVDQCLSSTICVLPNSTYSVNTSYAQCQATGSCTQFCAPKCRSVPFQSGACYSTALNSTSCSSQGGFYTFTSNACVLLNVTSATNCPLGFVWESCSGLSTDECGQCHEGDDAACPVNQNVMKCFLDFTTPCDNSTVCVNSGYCSNREKLLRIDNSTFPPSLATFGACIVPKVEPLLSSNYANVLLLPFCNLPLDSFPNGCIDYTMNYTQCITNNFTWWFPSFTEDACLAAEGCYDVYTEYFVPDLQFIFSPKNKTDCESPYNNGGTSTWKSYFTWKPAQWIPGTMRNLSWIQREVKQTYQWKSAIDFDMAMDSFLQGSIVEGALAVKSSILCSNSRTEQAFYTVSCDCTGASDSEQCFGNSISSPAGEGLPCPGIQTELTTSSSIIFFANDSVVDTCVDVLVSEISRTQYRKQPKPKLSANFATFKAKEEFAVKNNKDAIIGKLLGDGIEVTATKEVTDAYLCLKIEDTSSSSFKVWDFGYTDAKYEKITPLELSGVADTPDGMLCATVSFDTTTRSFFPIVRKDGWSSAEPQTYDTTTTGLIYTLAILFLGVTVLAFAKIVLETVFIFRKRAKFDVKYFAILFTFMFNFLRSVYFFIAPTGLDNAAADFLMVILPTFFYFTAFTLIIVVWAVMCLSSISSNTKRYMQMSYYGAAIINGILYVFFVIIVLIFQYGSTDTPTQCGGRVEEDNSREKFQQIIAIVYATVIAVVSLAIGVSYMYFGGKLYWQLRKSGSGRKQSQRKIFLLTLVSSIGFILHCIFLVILTAQSQPSVIFSFVGLIVTEIIPSCYLLVAFNKFKKNSVSKSTQNSMVMNENTGGNGSN